MKKILSKILVTLSKYTYAAAAKLSGITVGEAAIELPANVLASESITNPDMRFSMNLEFDVKVNKAEGTLGVYLSNMLFASDDKNAKEYLHGTDPKLARDTAALLALVACKQIMASPSAGFQLGMVLDDQITFDDQIDPKLLN